jgi:BMFP domain-containing protein YqiC
MQSENPVIADFVKLANAAAGTLAGMTREARDGARERMKEAFGGLDFVSREEFDAVKDMAARAREHAAKLEERIAALEAKAGKLFAAPRREAAPPSFRHPSFHSPCSPFRHPRERGDPVSSLAQELTGFPRSRE